MPQKKWTDLNDVDDFIPLVSEGRYQIVCTEPMLLDAFGNWSVLVLVPAFSIMTRVAVNATNPLTAIMNATLFVDTHYDSLIEDTIKRRQHLLRN